MIKKALLIIAVLFISINSNFLSNQERSFYFLYFGETTQNILMNVGEVILIHGDCARTMDFDFVLKGDFKSELVNIGEKGFIVKDSRDLCVYKVTAEKPGYISINFILKYDEGDTDMFANIVIQ